MNWFNIAVEGSRLAEEIWSGTRNVGGSDFWFREQRQPRHPSLQEPRRNDYQRSTSDKKMNGHISEFFVLKKVKWLFQRCEDSRIGQAGVYGCQRPYGQPAPTFR